MLAYLLRRLIAFLFVVVGITLLTFVISRLVPADPALAAAGQNATKQQIAIIRERLNLDRPLPVQYLDYLAGLLHGDLGRSIQTNRPIADDVRTYFPATLELTFVTMVIYTALGVPLGIIAAMRRGWLDRLTNTVSVAGVAVPPFWLALVLQLIFFGMLGWLPYGARLDQHLTPPHPVTGLYTVDALLQRDLGIFFNALQHLFLPAMTLAIGRLGAIMRITRRSVRDVAGQDFVRTARGKGLSEQSVLSRHIVRNSLLPIVTMIGLQFGWLLNGAVVIEVIFNWPGIGQYAVNAISFGDFPAVMGVALVVALMFVLINFVVDLSYRWIDPRMAT